MLKYSRVFIIILIVLFILVFDITQEFVFKGKKVPSSNKVILIYAWHGGRDYRAIVKNGAIEKEINLSISKRSTAIFVECGFLSNPEEKILIQQEDYQNKLSGLYIVD